MMGAWETGEGETAGETGRADQDPGADGAAERAHAVHAGGADAGDRAEPDRGAGARGRGPGPADPRADGTRRPGGELVGLLARGRGTAHDPHPGPPRPTPPH